MRLIRWIDKLSEWTGRAIAWAIVPLTFIVIFEVCLRYIFNRPTDWAYDTAWMLYSAFFLMGGAYTLLHRRHIRIDVLYQFLTPRSRAIFDSILFLLVFLPPVGVIAWHGVRFAVHAWAIGETIQSTTWGPPAGPIRTVIPLAFIVMWLQVVAELVRSLVRAKKGEEL